MVRKQNAPELTLTASDLSRLSLYVVGGIVVLVLISGLWTTVQPGQRGVLIRLGEIQRVVEPGLVIKVPIIDRVAIVDVKTQKYSSGETAMEAASSDSQDVYVKASFNYRILPGNAFEFYQRVSTKDYRSTVIAPIFEQSVKASTVNYEAESLLANRNNLKTDIENELTARLELYGIEVEGVNVENIDFRPEFRNAIERKAVAKQNLLAEERELEITKIQAQRAAEKAKGDAEAMLLQKEAEAKAKLLIAEAEAKELELKKQHTTTALVELEWIRAWNGVLPPFTFGSNQDVMPILNIGGDGTQAIIPADWE